MHRTDFHIWLAACILFVGGDIITTAWALQAGLAESNPIPALVMAEVGIIPAMVAGKIVVMGTVLGIYAAAPERHNPQLIPITLACIGAAITAWNVVQVLAA